LVGHFQQVPRLVGGLDDHAAGAVLLPAAS
jgi:hypothetical protein